MANFNLNAVCMNVAEMAINANVVGLTGQGSSFLSPWQSPLPHMLRDTYRSERKPTRGLPSRAGRPAACETGCVAGHATGLSRTGKPESFGRVRSSLTAISGL